jgi:hypothetical protein
VLRELIKCLYELRERAHQVTQAHVPYLCTETYRNWKNFVSREKKKDMRLDFLDLVKFLKFVFRVDAETVMGSYYQVRRYGQSCGASNSPIFVISHLPCLAKFRPGQISTLLDETNVNLNCENVLYSMLLKFEWYTIEKIHKLEQMLYQTV